VTTEGATPNQDAVTCEIEIEAPPERVFQGAHGSTATLHLVGKRANRAVVGVRDGCTPGRKLAVPMQAGPGCDHGAVVEQFRRNGAQDFEAHGEVLEYVPPRLLVWSWIANWHEHPTQPTVVRWELLPTARGTRVRVTHSALTKEPTARKDYTGGWTGVLRLLRGFLER
jgi:uncharacterized protein YndB with AHSA1/START domain